MFITIGTTFTVATPSSTVLSIPLFPLQTVVNVNPMFEWTMPLQWWKGLPNDRVLLHSRLTPSWTMLLGKGKAVSSPDQSLIPRLSQSESHSQALPIRVSFPGSPNQSLIPRLSQSESHSQTLPIRVSIPGSPDQSLIPRLSQSESHSQALPIRVSFPDSPNQSLNPRLSQSESHSQALPIRVSFPGSPN